MRALRARRPLAAVLVVAALAAAGCSGDDDDVGTASNDASASSVTADASGSTVAAATAPNATGPGTASTALAGTATTVASAASVAPAATGPTSGPQGGDGPLATRDLTGQDLCPVLSGGDVSAVVGVPIGQVEANPSYKDPNCVYYRAEAGQAVSVTKADAAYYDSQGAQAASVSGVGDAAKWSAQQLTLFVKAKGATLVVSVYQVGSPGGEQAAAVAVAQKVVANI